ncbi:hypothetical protein DH2020_013299 [Rehmannia glutinosa]|uniref:Retrotransposon Copia-like N-terminal domain-containing protein n=1 Tax=Rehmannia glutinosa TaxID=99300 RepID=A0ABR0X5N2_REHGL
MATFSVSSVVCNFSTPSIKLDRNNYTYWRIQVLSVVRAHGFEDFLFGKTTAPPQFVVLDESSSSLTSNPEYLLWTRRDQTLFSWLLASVSESMLGYINRCTTSSEIWSVFETLFRSQSRARISHLRAQLLNTKKSDLSIEEYVLKMRGIVDNLLAAGQDISDDDLIMYILSGFGAEFGSVVVNLYARSDSLTLNGVQYALQSHEMRLQQLSSQSPMVSEVDHPSAQCAAKGSGNPQSRGGGFGSRGRGRFNRFKPTRQICGKTNHIASKCFKRFDMNFPGINLTSAQDHVATQQCAFSQPFPSSYNPFAHNMDISKSAGSTFVAQPRSFSTVYISL